MRWSPDPADYDPMCRPCHGDRDRDDYQRGYRHDPEKRRAYARLAYAREVATEEGRRRYRERKRRERDQRAARSVTAQPTVTDGP